MKIFPSATLRSHVVVLVIASIVPLALFAGALIHSAHQKQQVLIERGMQDTARALSTALDREFTGAIQALKVLASSKSLAHGRLAAFYEEMQDALAAYGSGWLNIGLIGRNGEHLLNLRRPFGSPLPRMDPELIERTLHTGEPSISNIFRGPITGAPSMIVSVPVLRDGQIKYVLSAGLSTVRLSALLSQQELPANAIATILDGNQVIVARTRNLEKYLGTPAGATLAAQARQNREAIISGMTRDGIDTIGALRHSDLSGWTVAFGIPAAAVDVPLRNSLMLAGAVGLAFLGASVFFAVFIGRRVVRGANHLTGAAHALGRGEIPRMQPSQLAELDDVARALEQAAGKRTEGEVKLQESEERFRSIFEQAAVGIAQSDLEGRYTVTNQMFADLLGYTRQELAGMPIRDIAPVEEMEDAGRSLETLLQQGLDSVSGERRLVRRDGSMIRTNCTMSIICRGSGEPICYMGVYEDITERKQSEDALRESEKHLRELSRRLIDAQEKERQILARELHDRVGQNLAVLGINLTRLRGEKASPAETQARIDDSLAVLEATGKVISDVLTDLKPPMLSNYGLLEAIRWHANVLARRTGLAVEVTGPALPRLTSEIDMALFRIAQGALNNVAQHARARNIGVRLEAGERTVRLVVADDGSGFDAAAALASARWGLATMKERAEAIRGSLRIESAPGRGTRIIAEVPATRIIAEVLAVS